MHGVEFIQDLAVILAVAAPVAWLCQRVGLSVVVGFIVAGIVVGPHAPWLSLVTDADRIEVLAQVGLVFLMFGIGLELSVRRLRRLGLGLVVAVSLYALLINMMVRLLNVSLGWSSIEVLFLAGMLMISSSSIIGKILRETGTTHERPGQLALGALVCEDVLAILLLTLLNSIVTLGDSGLGASVMVTVGRLGAFVVLMGIAGLLLVPWALKRMSIAADEELQTLGIAALLLSLAVIAERAGFSLALGAILLGAIVAETPHRVQIDRIFEGMRDVFSAVFFVAIGMQIDLQLVGDSIGLIFGLALFTLVVRGTGVSLGLALTGTPARTALRTGLSMTPVGEFSFIIAQLGVSAAVLPERIYPVIVGVSLLTTLTAPVLTRHSDFLAEKILKRQPRWMGTLWGHFQGWKDRIDQRRSRNLLWQLSRKRLIQVSVGLLFVTGLVVFSGPLLDLLEERLGGGWLFPNDLQVIYWTALGLIALAPLLAVWRNISAMSLLYAEVLTQGHARQARQRPVVEAVLKLAAAGGLFLWLMAILPATGSVRWLLPAVAGVAALALLLLRRKFIYWHSELEVELLDMINDEGRKFSATSAPWLRPHEDWNLHIMDCVLPDLTDCQGQRISDLRLRSRIGCTVVGIERQGFMMPLPGPETVLYPRDKVLLLGTVAQVRKGKEFLGSVTGAAGPPSVFEEVSMEMVSLPDWSRAAGLTLHEVAPARQHGVLVAGLNRGGVRILNPDATEVLRPGDEILLLGTAEQLRNFKLWLRERPGGEAGGESG